LIVVSICNIPVDKLLRNLLQVAASQTNRKVILLGPQKWVQLANLSNLRDETIIAGNLLAQFNCTHTPYHKTFGHSGRAFLHLNTSQMLSIRPDAIEPKKFSLYMEKIDCENISCFKLVVLLKYSNMIRFSFFISRARQDDRADRKRVFNLQTILPGDVEISNVSRIRFLDLHDG